MNLENYLDLYTNKNLTIVGPVGTKLNEHIPEPVIFVDGGQNFKGNFSGFSVGDGDSSNKDLDQILPQEKDYSDLAYVFSKITGSHKKIDLFGLLGERKDHELINLGEAHHFLKRTKASVLNFENKILAFSAPNQFDFNGTFSILNFESCHLKITGDCKYKVRESESFPPLTSKLLSNEGFGTIKIDCQSPVFIFFN